MVAKLAALVQLHYIPLQRMSDIKAMLRISQNGRMMKTFRSFTYLFEISENLDLTGAIMILTSTARKLTLLTTLKPDSLTC